jgi:hypothetical protein
LTRSLFREALLVFAALLFGAAGLAQEPTEQPPPKPERFQFWSGVVTEVEETAVTVRRKLMGRKPELKRFILNGETKVEGALKVNARVTVAFTKSEDGDIARRILVRTR